MAKRDDPAKLSDRARRDAALKIEVRRVLDANFRVYGVRKIWRQLRREGFDVARCTVARLMRAMGLAGVIRGKPVRTSRAPIAFQKAIEALNDIGEWRDSYEKLTAAYVRRRVTRA